jgi:hypothetical protein
MILVKEEIYEDQPLTVILQAGKTGQLTVEQLAAATPKVLVYDHNGIQSYKTTTDGVAVVTGTTKISYKFPGGILKTGMWQVHSDVTLSGDTHSIPGSAVIFNVLKREKVTL